MAADTLVLVETDDRRVVTITLARPEARNALSPDLVARLTDAVHVAGADPRTRAVVLTGAGPAFSAGGDITSLSEMASWSYADNLADSHANDTLFRTVDQCPCPVIARVNGPAFGGGAGLVACADIAVASRAAVFAFSEVRVGIIPAVISTYVVPRIGVPWARRLLVTGERFDAEQAFGIGLVHEVVEPDDLDRAVADAVDQVLAGWPGAQRRIKRLVVENFVTGHPDRQAAAAAAAKAAAEARMADEGVQGLRAFLARAKQPPASR
jgi:methylglutaconyl-CoA hydratase